MEFYSVKHKRKIQVEDDKVEEITMKNGRKACQATVDVDGEPIKLFKIGGKPAAAA